MFYLQVIAPTAREQKSMPRDLEQGPFTSRIEAQGYWAKLNMWFPEALRGANYRITARTAQQDSARGVTTDC
jgi:hypothetical protein